MIERIKKFFEDKDGFEDEQQAEHNKAIEEAAERLFNHIEAIARDSHFSPKVTLDYSEVIQIAGDDVFASEAVLRLVKKCKGWLKSSRSGNTYTFEFIKKKED